MGTKDQGGGAVQRVTEQQVQVATSGNEVRKGVNVLTTSDPKNAAPNPFVQAQNQGSAQGKQAIPAGSNEGKPSE